VTPAELKGYAKSIQRKYISQEAEMSLRLPDDIAEQIDTGLLEASPSRGLFDKAEELVYRELETDIFPRFFYSLAGKKYLAKVMDEEKQQQLAFNSGVMRITAESTRKPPERPGTRIRRYFCFWFWFSPSLPCLSTFASIVLVRAAV